MLRALASLVVRHRRLTLALWGVLLALSVVVGSGVINKLSTDVRGKRGTESAQVADRLDSLGMPSPDVVAMVDGLPLADPATKAALTSAAGDIDQIRGVAEVHTAADIPLLVSQDGNAGLVAVLFDHELDGAAKSQTVDAVTARLRAIDAPTVLVGGNELAGRDTLHQAESDLKKAELLSLPVVLLLTIAIFGGLFAASLPLVIALVSVPGAMLVLDLLSRLTQLHVFALNAATMLGLGLAVDYGLLMVSRFRDERAVGRDVDEAVRRTVATAGTTVTFSGLTVSVALLGFIVFDNDIFRSIGLGGIGVVLFAMAAAVTLLPAVLATWGHRIRPARALKKGQYFSRVARLVQRRAAFVTAIVAAGLVLLAVPFVGARLQMPGVEALPKSAETRQLFDAEQARFTIGGDDPITVIAQADASQLGDYAARIRTIPGVRNVDVQETSEPGTTVIEVVPDGAAQGRTAEHIVREIRRIDAGTTTQVGGPAASLIDQRDSLYSRLPLALGVIAVSTFVLLFLLTGSVLIPIKAILMNLLSLTATFGVLVWGFQQGHLAGVLGFDTTGYLSLWLPFLVFFLAFGLSMDYEVFLLARIKEDWERTHDNDLAVARGLQRTGRIITSAALLIGVVFAAFATGESLEMKAVGVGLTLAILLDATVVRTLLVPSTMKLLGRWNWWAPKPLRTLHAKFGLSEPGEAAPGPAPVPVPASEAAA